MMIRWLLWGVFVGLLLRTSEGQGTSSTCSGCMADVRGPYQDLTAPLTPNIDTVEANESMPAVFYCTFTCQSNYTSGYNFRLYTDIIYDRSLSNRRFSRSMTSLDLEGLHEEDHFNITTTEISSCNVTNNEHTYEIQIDLSIDQETPTLIPKCAVQYNSNLCSGFDTFVIIPLIISPTVTSEDPTSTSIAPSPTITVKNTATSQFQTPHPTVTVMTSPQNEGPTSTSIAPSPTITVENTATSRFQPPHPTVTISPQNDTLCMQGCISYRVFGSWVGVLGVLLATETAVLILLMLCCLVKKSKSKKIKPHDEVMIINHGSNANKAISLPMTTHNLSRLGPDDDSAMGTVSTISNSVADVNNECR